MERAIIKSKLPRHKDEGEMKRVATAPEPHVIVPVVVALVDVHVALVVPVVEVREVV